MFSFGPECQRRGSDSLSLRPGRRRLWKLSPFYVSLSALLRNETGSSSTLPSWILEAMKVTTNNSPDSPLSAPFDADNFSALSNIQEKYGSTEYLSLISSFYNSCLESDYFHRSPTTIQANIQVQRARYFSHDSDVGYGSRMRDKLQEIETVLMAPDADETSHRGDVPENNTKPESSKRKKGSWADEFRRDSHKLAPEIYPSNKYRKPEQVFLNKHPEPLPGIYCHQVTQRNLRQLLTQCADALWQNKEDEFDKLVSDARNIVAINGEPIQRLGAYMIEGLVARKEVSGSSIYRALKCREPDSNDLLSYMHILYEICPYFKFGCMAANGAMAEAFKNEDKVHIIDFQIVQGTQWVTLLQALAARPGGPPQVRITGIDDPVLKYARGEGLESVGRRLAAISEKYKIPVIFHALSEFGRDVKPEMLHIHPGEALAVNFTFQLHHTPDESVDVNNPRDGLLRMIKSLSPKVTTLVEQESNTNTAPFFARFMETLEYYSAMFESIDAKLPRDNKDRINVEQHCLARDIVNIIACEGKERVERHELLGKWRSRLTMAGFRPYPLSSYVNSVLRSLLRSYSEHYTLLERDEALLLGWKNRNLVSASAWC